MYQCPKLMETLVLLLRTLNSIQGKVAQSTNSKKDFTMGPNRIDVHHHFVPDFYREGQLQRIFRYIVHLLTMSTSTSRDSIWW